MKKVRTKSRSPGPDMEQLLSSAQDELLAGASFVSPSPLAQLHMARIKSLLRPPGDRADARVLAGLATLEIVANGRRVAVVVSGLDQKPACVSGPGLGDPPEPSPFIGGPLTRHEPEI